MKCMICLIILVYSMNKTVISTLDIDVRHNNQEHQNGSCILVLSSLIGF